MDNQHQKIKGYRDLNQQDIDLMNEGKELAEKCGAFIDKLNAHPETDLRWVNMAQDDLQKGFMAATRSIAKPTSF